ncbi:MAG: sulfur carrier protein ThiS [Kiritimatiellae bacterium]|jgi:sulfur carrier protein|nr:sulfur carrier protein ThiS [Kiritimatiellia bacterium]
MNIQVNGENREIRPGETLAGLVKKLKPGKQRVAVLLNDKLIAAEKRAGHILKEDDCVEILTFAGGG